MKSLLSMGLELPEGHLDNPIRHPIWMHPWDSLYICMTAISGRYSMTVHAASVAGHPWGEAVQYFNLHDLLQWVSTPVLLP